MGLFSRKKKKEEEYEIPPLNLPEIPKKFPSYHPEPKIPKHEAPHKALDLPPIPSRKPEFHLPDLNLPQRKPMNFNQPPIHKEIPKPIIPQKPVHIPEHHIETRIPQQSREKPLFIEIENYEDAINHIKEIKEHLSNSESILDELETLKNKEERELQNWRATLNRIKNNLVLINNKLSE